MNERIKEFRFKAAEYANELKPVGIMRWNEIRDLKFAELIIMDCINECHKHDPHADSWSDEVERAESRAVHKCIKAIKEHFGI